MPENTTTITPKSTISLADFRELWEYRELFYFFVWRDLKVRYKQTLIGVAWAIFQPLITMVIFTIFFGQMLKVPSDDTPYPIFVFVGLLLWQFFSGTLTDSARSLVDNQAILSKIYFPRLVLPISSALTKLVDFFVASIILVILMAYYGFMPSLTGFFLLPVLLVLTFMTSVGFGLFLASLSVKYRDVRYVLPFFIQLLLFVTPVIYTPSIVGKYWFLALNPMTGIIKVARAALFGNPAINWELFFVSCLGSSLLLIFGFLYFKRTEKYFADIV